jgi:hypothetical protein
MSVVEFRNPHAIPELSNLLRTLSQTCCVRVTVTSTKIIWCVAEFAPYGAVLSKVNMSPTYTPAGNCVPESGVTDKMRPAACQAGTKALARTQGTLPWVSRPGGFGPTSQFQPLK